MPSYTVEDLRELDLMCIEKAKVLMPGLEVPEVLFHLVQAEEMYDIAARGFPGRYSHYQFGRQYEKQKGDYDKGKGRIYELVINTTPVHAYLLDGNSIISQVVVMAHVYGHAMVFEHNHYFEPADKNIMARVKAAAERVDDYIQEHGRTAVENFIDAAEALANQRSWDQFAKPREASVPEREMWKYDELFPNEVDLEKKLHAIEKEDFKARFPKKPERDTLAFIEKHSRTLEDWQRDIISIIRTEHDYFIPQAHTKILNEGLAVYFHTHIIQEMMGENDRFTTEDFAEYASMNARVLHPSIDYDTDEDEDGRPILVVYCRSINPYLLGSTILEEIRRMCTDPTKEELDPDSRWYRPWAGTADPDEKMAEIIQGYNDAALLAEFLTPTICEKAKIFEYSRTTKEFHDLHVTEAEFDEMYPKIIESKLTFGVPTVEIVDADAGDGGELWLVHRHTGKGLDDEYTRGTILRLVQLWNHPVVVETIDEDGDPIWYRGLPDDIILDDIASGSEPPD